MCAIKTALEKMPGLDRDFTASNEKMTRWWRADYLDVGRWKLAGAPVKLSDFTPSRFLRIWEYGVGDRIRCDTDVSVRRLADDVYEVAGSVTVRLGIPANGLDLSIDRQTWIPLPGKADVGWFECTLPLGDRPGEQVYVRRAGR